MMVHPAGMQATALHGTASFLLSQPRVSALKQWRIKGALRPAHAVLENYELKIDKS